MESEFLRKLIQEGAIHLYKEGKETEELMDTNNLREILSEMKIDEAVIFGTLPDNALTIKIKFEGNDVYIKLIKCIENVPYLKDNSGCFYPLIDNNISTGETVSDKCIIVYGNAKDTSVPSIDADIYNWNKEEHNVGKIGKYILASILSKKYKSIILANDNVNFQMCAEHINNLFNFSKENPDTIGCQKGFDFQDSFFNRKKKLSNSECEYTESNLSIYPSTIFLKFIEWYIKMNIFSHGSEDLLMCTWCKINDIKIKTVNNSGTIFCYTKSSDVYDKTELENIYRNTWCTLISRKPSVINESKGNSRNVYVAKLKDPRMKYLREITEKADYCIYDSNIDWSHEPDYRTYYIEEYLNSNEKWCKKEYSKVNDNDMVRICKLEGDKLNVSACYSGVKYKVSNDSKVPIEEIKSEDLSFGYVPEKTEGTIELINEENDKILIIFGRKNFDFYYDFSKKKHNFNIIFMKQYNENNDYYLTLLEQNLEYLRNKIKESGSTKVYMLGVEEGGYSCVLYGKLLNVYKSISISPVLPRREEVNKNRRKYLNLNKILGACKYIVTNSTSIIGKNVEYKKFLRENYSDLIELIED